MVTSAACIGPGAPGTAAAAATRTGRVFDIKRYSSHDGPGIRSTVFFTGCPMRCGWCHNPEAFMLERINPTPQVRELTVRALIRELERDVPYFDRSGGGVTLSGGEPLFQAAFVLELLDACRQRDLHTAIDTCGLVDPVVLAKAAALTNLILYDIKAVDPVVHRDWTGVDNATVIENLKLLDALSTPVWIRLPVIPGVNDDDRSLDAVISMLAGMRFHRISLLPYHRIADGKYQRLGLPNRMSGVEPPSSGRIQELAARLAEAGFHPRIGS